MGPQGRVTDLTDIRISRVPEQPKGKTVDWSLIWLGRSTRP